MWHAKFKVFPIWLFKTLSQALQMKCYRAILSKTSPKAKKIRTQKSKDMLALIQALSRS